MHERQGNLTQNKLVLVQVMDSVDPYVPYFPLEFRTEDFKDVMSAFKSGLLKKVTFELSNGPTIVYEASNA